MQSATKSRAPSARTGSRMFRVLALALALALGCAGVPEPFDSSPEGEMVLIPTGVTLIDFYNRWERVGAYFIDVTEVTVGAYRRCVEDDDGPCPSPFAGEGCLYWSGSDVDDYPMNCISRKEAIDYCAWRNPGAHLPRYVDWIRAARGDDDRLYPWGQDSPSCSHTASACTPPTLAPVKAKPLGASLFGVYDMVGNVEEWIWESDTYYEDPDDVPGVVAGVGVEEIGQVSPEEATGNAPSRGFRCVLPVD